MTAGDFVAGQHQCVQHKAPKTSGVPIKITRIVHISLNVKVTNLEIFRRALRRQDISARFYPDCRKHLTGRGDQFDAVTLSLPSRQSQRVPLYRLVVSEYCNA